MTKESTNAQQVLQCMTTEHFVLQTARAATIQEANQRANLFLTSVSSVTIALSFVAQVTEMGMPFVLFSLILLPCLFFIGLVTFVRAVQVAIEDMVHARGMARIRLLRRTRADHAKVPYPLYARRPLGRARRQGTESIAPAVFHDDRRHGEYDQRLDRRRLCGHSCDIGDRFRDGSRRDFRNFGFRYKHLASAPLPRSSLGDSRAEIDDTFPGRAWEMMSCGPAQPAGYRLNPARAVRMACLALYEVGCSPSQLGARGKSLWAGEAKEPPDWLIVRTLISIW